MPVEETQAEWRKLRELLYPGSSNDARTTMNQQTNQLERLIELDENKPPLRAEKFEVLM